MIDKVFARLGGVLLSAPVVVASGMTVLILGGLWGGQWLTPERYGQFRDTHANLNKRTQLEAGVPAKPQASTRKLLAELGALQAEAEILLLPAAKSAPPKLSSRAYNYMSVVHITPQPKSTVRDPFSPLPPLTPALLQTLETQAILSSPLANETPQGAGPVATPLGDGLSQKPSALPEKAS